MPMARCFNFSFLGTNIDHQVAVNITESAHRTRGNHVEHHLVRRGSFHP